MCVEKIKPIFMVGLLIFMSGCAHQLMRGSIVMKISKNQAHICMGRGEVAEGDHVTLFKNDCQSGNKSTTSVIKENDIKICQKVKLGEAKVISILNEHYSIIQIEQGIPFDERTIIEKN